MRHCSQLLVRSLKKEEATGGDGRFFSCDRSDIWRDPGPWAFKGGREMRDSPEISAGGV